MSPSPAFQVGERVVYPNHGVGTIENISVRDFGERRERFYLLRLAGNSLTVMIPFSHVNELGLRRVTRNGESLRVLEFLATGKPRTCADWKDRYKENSERMRTGTLLDVAEVLKCLLLQQQLRPLSFREKKMLNKARQLLVSEFSTARAVPPEAAAELLRKALSKAALTLPEPL